jgi:hypothetical protein
MPKPQTIKVTETYNNEYLQALLNVDTKHEDYPKDGNKNDHFISTEEQTKLINLLKGIKLDQKLNVYTKKVVFSKKVYTDPKTNESVSYGRLFGDKRSIQEMWKFIRKIASNGKVIGFDLSNSQPNILNQLCKKYVPDEKFTHLDAYTRNRDAMKWEIEKHYNCKPDVAKNLIIRLVFGGEIGEWKEYWELNVEKDLDFVKGFEKEMKEIREIHAFNFDKYDISIKVFNIKKRSGQIEPGKCPFRSMIAMYLQNIEGDMLLHWANDVLPKLNVDVATPIHDEINVLASEYVLNNKELIMCKLQESTKQEFGFDVVLKEENYTVSDLDKKQIEDHLLYAEANDFLYDIIKQKFEDTSFKINDTSEFGYENFEKNLIVMPKANFSIRWEELTYKKQKFVNNAWIDVDESFMKSWFADPNKRVYDKYDFIPRPLTCPDNVYNMWKGFDIEQIDVEPKDCKDILNLIWVLSGKSEDSYEYLMDWLAHMFQFPAQKNGTAIILKSRPGAGKGSLIEILRKMMGSLIGETSNPQEDIFGKHGNTHIGKILTSLDEVKNSDTNKILGRLKNIITSPKCIYNEKGLKRVELNSMSRFIFTTNEAIPLSIDGKEDRRYCFIECSDDYCKKADFWKQFYKKNVNDIGVIKGFYNHLMSLDVSERDWMNFPDTEFRKDIISVSIHPIIFWFDRYIHKMVNTEEKVGMSQLFNSYKKYCSKNNINVVGNVNGFGLNFKSKINFESCKIEKVKSMGLMKLVIDRKKVFEWLKDNDFTVYESLCPFEEVEEVESDDELEP